MALTFFAWGDTHFGYEQKFLTDDFRAGIIEQMNRLPGWPYPQEADGCVAEPGFVMHCGDFVTDSRQGRRDLDTYRSFIARLRFKHYETLGNHDLGDKAMEYFTGRYGGDCYAFSVDGMLFLSLAGEYGADETSAIGTAQMAFLAKQLEKKESPDKPVILFTHSPLRDQANAREIRNTLQGRRIALAVAAHKHHPAFYQWEGINCIDLGHCRNHPIDPEYGRSFTVVRIDGNRVRALPWRWDCRDWDRQQRWGMDAPEERQRFRMDATF